jgi:hypothetical protein
MAEPLSYGKEVERLTDETRMRGFVEYPKALHRTDGSLVIVTNKREEESALSDGDVHPTPAEAQAEKQKRDAAEAKRRAEKIGAEAKAASKEPKN